MSDFRELQAKLEKIDESYYSRLAAAVDDIALYNQRMPADELVELIRNELGDQAAEYMRDKLAKGGRIEENGDVAREQFHSKLKGEIFAKGDRVFYEPISGQALGERGKGYGTVVGMLTNDYGEPNAVVEWDDEEHGAMGRLIHPAHLIRVDKNEDESFWNHMDTNNPFEGLEEANLDGTDTAEELVTNVLAEYGLENLISVKSQLTDWGRKITATVNDVSTITFTMQIEQAIKQQFARQGKEVKRVIIRGNEVIVLMNDPASKGAQESIEETQMPDLSRYMVYIDRPDVDYIMYHIGRSQAEEGEPRFLKVDKATGDWQTQVWKKNNEPAIQQGKGTGQHRVEEDAFIHEEDSINDQITGLLKQGKRVVSKVAGAMGDVIAIGSEGISMVKHPSETRRGTSAVNFNTFSNLEIVGNVDHYDIIQHSYNVQDDGIDEDVSEWMKRLDNINEAIVEVPVGLRGEGAENLEQGGATSRDAERFLADLGPEDSVDTNVVDPETGELLDWPTKDTQRAQDDEELQQQMDREEEEEEYDSTFRIPYIPGGSRKLGAGGVASFDGMDRAMEDLSKLRWDSQITDFYDITWKNIEDLVDNPSMYYDGDYDISWDMPVAIKRTDGQKFTDEDHNNFRRLTSLFRSATYNISASYVGVTDNGTVARFVPAFH